MGRIIIIAIIAAIALAVSGSATIINIPADYPTIQAGINASTDGDTVLVQPGTYVENINFNGHNVVLGSLFLTTGDTAYIAETVIDGDSSGSVVTFESGEDSTTCLKGFTIEYGFSTYGGGIYIVDSDPTIADNIICHNTAYYSNSEFGQGGGIYCLDFYGIITKNIIYTNGAEWGGGIYCLRSNCSISYNLIRDNTASGHAEHYDAGGGGIYISDSSILIEGNLIFYNRAAAGLAFAYGGGLFSAFSETTLINNTVYQNTSDDSPYDALQEINLYGGTMAVRNTIIWSEEHTIAINGYGDILIEYSDVINGYEGEGNIDIDPLFFDPRTRNLNVCTQSPCIDAGDPNIEDPDSSRSDIGVFFEIRPVCFNRIYVSVLGNDITGDGSYENPYRTIQFGVGVSYRRDSVIVENGTYYENIIINGRYLTLTSNYIYSGNIADINNTIIDGNSESSVVRILNWSDNFEINGFTLRNGNAIEGGGIYCFNSSPRIVNNYIRENIAYGYAGILCKMYSNAAIINNEVYNNTALLIGGGIGSYHSNPLLFNNIIAGNLTTQEGSIGGGIVCYQNSQPTIINNAIGENYADSIAGGLYCGINSNPLILNTNFWGNEAGFGSEIGLDSSSSPAITYSNIQGGWEGEGNIDIDPLFRDPENGDFHLMSTACGDAYDSPCIDTGDPSIEDILLDCFWGLGELRSDMGAYGGGDSTLVGIDEPVVDLPDEFALLQNFPNPFNPSTTISYVLREQFDVRIEIYNILGQRVATLFDGNRQAGYHSVVWQADDYPSGVYFARLEAGKRSENIKMVLLK